MRFARQSYQPLPIEVEPAHTRKQMLAGYAIAAGGSALFSSKAIFIKLAYGSAPELDPMTLLAIRMGLAVPIYMLIAVWAFRSPKTPRPSHITKRHYFAAGAMGLLGYYFASILDFTGLLYITAQLERLILFTYPAFVMVLGAMFFGKRIRVAGLVSMLIAYSGLAVIFARGSIASGEHVLLGSLLVFGAAFSFAIFQLIAGKQISIFGSALFTCMAMTCAGFGILTHFAVESVITGQFERLHQPKEIWLLGAGIAVVATLIPSFMINIALGRIGAQAVAVVGMVSPLATIIFAVTLLNEPFGFVDGLGTALTIFGIGLFTWFAQREKKIPTASPAD